MNTSKALEGFFLEIVTLGALFAEQAPAVPADQGTTALVGEDFQASSVSLDPWQPRLENGFKTFGQFPAYFLGQSGPHYPSGPPGALLTREFPDWRLDIGTKS